MYYMNLNKIINKSGYYRLKVIPNQPAAMLKDEMEDGTIKIALVSPPQKGRANKELISFLSDELGIERKNIKIISGLASRIKIISIELEK